MKMDNDIERILFTEEEILNACEQLGKRISKDYEGKKPLIVGILRGAIPFLETLTKHLDLYCTFDYMVCSSFEGQTQSTGVVHLKQDIHTDVKGKDVLIVEDIVDSGLTMQMVKELFISRGANSVKVVALLDKKEGRKFPFDVDYYAFDVENQFVVGFGLDYQEYYRNLPYVGVLKKEIYTKKL